MGPSGSGVGSLFALDQNVVRQNLNPARANIEMFQSYVRPSSLQLDLGFFPTPSAPYACEMLVLVWVVLSSD